MLGIAKGSVELIVASQLLVSNETEKSLQCAFNAALLRRPEPGCIKPTIKCPLN